MRVHIERDAEIYAKRKAGKKLKALGEEYGLSKESIRRIECQEWRREQNPNQDDLPVRVENTIRNVLYADARRRGLGYRAVDDDPKAIAEQVAALGRDRFEGAYNCGKKTLATIEAWINKWGYQWK